MRSWSREWCGATMVTMGWVLVILVQLVGVTNCGGSSVEFYVPGGERVTDDLVRVTYDDGVGDEGSETGESFLQCCGWAMLPDSTRSLNCSIFSEDWKVSSNSSASPDFCLRLNSSLGSYIVTGSESRGRTNHGHCALRVDAAVSLSLYLNWFWPRGSLIRASFLALVQTRAECSNNNLPCRLTISTKSAGVLGSVEWDGAVSSEQHVLLSQEYIAALRPQTKNPRKYEAQIFDFSVASVGSILSISKNVGAANAFRLGRRSLLVSTHLCPHGALNSVAMQANQCVTQ